MRELRQSHGAGHVGVPPVAPGGQRLDRNRVPRQREATVHVLVAHVQRRDGGGARDVERPAQPRRVPRPGDAEVGREHALHLPQGGGDRFEHGQIYAVGGGPHRERVGELAARHRNEREVQRQVRLHRQDLLSRSPEVESGVEPACPVLERAVHERRTELPQRPVGERERAGGHGVRTRPGESRRSGDRAADAGRVALQQRVHARERERLQLEMRVRAGARRQVARERELSRPVHTVQREGGHTSGRVGHGELGRPLEHPHVPR